MAAKNDVEIWNAFAFTTRKKNEGGRNKIPHVGIFSLLLRVGFYTVASSTSIKR